YALDTLYDGQPGENEAALLLGLAVERMADLAASYMVAGFVHGVLNTDNMNITGESFDYGPWRFAPTWEPGFTAAYFDHAGLYAFARQPEAIHWNLGQLAVALRLISDAPPLIAALERFGPLYQQALARRFCWRLGVVPQGLEQDRVLVAAAEALMLKGGVGIDDFFFAWMGDASPACPAALIDEPGEALWADFGALKAGYAAARDRSHLYWQGDAPQSMLIDEVESIWAAIAERDDWAPLHAKVEAVRSMGEALAG
ncbi:MAG: YdiU family protein, partial [Blastomonas sp.]|nr:YdiU family protein [Blastomonas sp.]